MIAALARRQHGVVSLEQLASVGLGAAAVQKRVEAGRLHRVHYGAYSVGYPLLSVEGRWMAAVLACGPGAVLSHRSAAALWGLCSDGQAAVDVTAPRRRGRSPSGVAAHRDGRLRVEDRAIVEGIPCTTVARTLLDFAGVVGMRQLRDAVGESEVLRVLDVEAVREVIRWGWGRRGVARLRLERLTE
jgi:predicted transcriptional regulator of viral defense system